MASFADYTKKKKKQSAVGLSFHEYTEQVLGRDDFDAPTYNTYNVTDEEDIAPVKGGNKNSVFKSGGFSDGVDGVGDFFGDLGETILGTAGDLGLNVIKGAGRLVEGVTDLATYGVAGVADLVGADEFAKKTKKFAQRNTVDDLTQDAEDYLDQYSILGDKADMVSEGLGQVASIILTGGIAGAAGLGTAGVTAITTGLTGLSGMGSGMSEAYGSGATDGEAVTYGLISGTAEAATEMLFGGLGKASKAIGVGKSAIPLDDILAKKVASRFTDQIAKNMVEFGIKAGAEGTEEVLSGILQAVGKKATYMTEKEIGEILADENLLEQFVIGTVTSGIAQSGYIPGMQNGSLRESIKTGKDFITGNTQNEQSVIDKEVQNRIAEQEKNGKKLTAKEIGDIEEQVQSDMEKGYFSTDTIEEVLGGESYKAYKSAVENENALQSEFDELNKMKQGEMTGEQIDRRAELKQQLAELKESGNTDSLKTKLSDEVFGLVKDSKLAESYNEKARRGQAFEADLSQYEEKYQGTIKKAVESGILNNTRRTHELVDFIAKVSADKGVLFDFTDNERLKNSSFAVDGKTVNGYVDENGNVVLNINSAKSLNSTTGHEITHILEGTELYQPLADIITEHAKTKGEYDSRLEALNKLYEGVYKGEDFADKVNKELVADLVGDYIFTDKAFVQKLSTENRNVFQKIYDEIKYLYKVATAGSKEARELEKVKKTFAEVYRESGTVKENTAENSGEKYSLSGINKDGIEVYETSKDIMDLTWDERKAKYLDVMKNEYQGRTARFERNGHIYYAEFDKKHINKHIYGDDRSSPKGRKALIKAGADGDVFDIVENSTYRRSKPNTKDHTDADYFDYFVKTVQIDGKVFDLIADVEKKYGVDGGYVYTLALTDNKKIKASPVIETSKDVSTQKTGNTFVEDIVTENTKSVKGKFSLSADSEGKQLSKEQSEYFKDSKMRDDNGNLKVMYHGSQDAGFHIFDAKMSDDDRSFFFVDRNDVAASYSGTTETYEARTIRTAEDMNNFLAEIGYEQYKAVEKDGKFELLENNEHVAYSDTAQGIYEEFCWYEGVGEGDANYKVYLNLKNPLVVDAEGRNWNNISREYSQEIADRYGKLTAEEKAALVDLAEWGEYSVFKDEMLDARAAAEQGVSSGFGDADFTKLLARAYEKLGGANANLYDAFSIASDNFSAESIQEFAVKQMNTRDYAKKAKEQGYDGVIFNNLLDNGGYSNGSEGASTVAIAFESNQIKSVANEKPTGNPDIRYSLSTDTQGKELSESQKEYFKDSKAVDENGSLKVVYHGTRKADFTEFKRNINYFTDNKEMADSYSPSGEMYKGYVNITNPFEIDAAGEKWSRIPIDEATKQLLQEYGAGVFKEGGKWRTTPADIASVIEEAVDNGDFDYDGIIIKNIDDTGSYYKGNEKHLGTDYIVFNSNQFKNADNANPTSNPDIRYSLTEYTEEEKKAHNEAAVDYFGKTYSWNETGYLLLNGTKLDFSGKHEGAPGGYRTVDHRDISDALDIEDYGGEDYSGSMVQFMSEGNIRIVPEINGINLSVKPTPEQESALSQFISRARGEIVLDIDDTNGYTVQSAEYPYGTHSNKVLNDIREWFDNGKELPRYSLSDQGKPLTKYGNFNIYGKDIALKTEPSQNVEDIAPVIEYDAPATEEEAIAQANENLASLDDADAPPEVYEQYDELADTTRLDDGAVKNISKALTDVLSLNRKESQLIKEVVQQYSTSEMPDKAELFWEIKERFGEKYYTETIEDVAEVRAALRKYRLNVSESIKVGISDYNTFRRSLFNKVTIAKDGMAVDTAYQELSELYPSFFPEDIINPTDQFLRIAEVANLDKTETMSFQVDDETIQEAVDIVADEVSSYKEATARIEAEDTARESIEDIAPLRAPQIVENANSQNDTLQQPIENVEYRQAKKLQSLEQELADNKQLRSEAISDYSERISRLTDEYVALKDKNSRKANDIVRRITRYERLKANIDADYSKRISGLETRIDEMKQNVKTDRVANVLVDEPAVEKKKGGGWQKFVTGFLDKGAVFEKLALKNKNRKLQAKYNFLHYSEGIAQRLIGKGTNGVKALNDIKAEVESTGKTEDFYKYLYHKHNVDRMNLEDRYDDVENKPVFGDYITSELSQGIANKIEAENPEFKAYADDVYTYMNYLRNQLVEKGVISQETADLWAEMYPHYVPIRRVGESGININVALDTNKTGVNAPIKKATGGNSDILPLFDTMAMRTLQTFKAAAKNNFGVELKNTLGTTIETAKTDIDGIIDSVDSHESLLQEGKDGKAPTFTVFENGERVTFAITEEMYDALKPTSKGLAYTNKAANFVSNLQRNVLTQYNPTFMLTNAAKDIQDVLLNSQHPAKTYASIPQALSEMITGKGKYYAEYIENGGEQNTYFENDSNSFAKEKTILRKIVGFPIDMIGKANDFIEKIPRLAEYIASRKSGASVEVAMLDAARVTTNFAAGGDVTKFLNRNGATFLNASVQGAMQQVRNLREAKANGLKGAFGLIAKTVIAGLPAILLNSLLWDDDEEYEELSDYVKDSYYIVGKTEDGQFIRIPKGRAVAVVQDAFEQIGNAVTGDDEVDYENFLVLLISNLAPNNPIDSNILAPIMQVRNNETWYGEDLVPTRLQDVPAAEQYDESTDLLSKWLGENLNYSPMKINYLLNQYSGGVGDVVLPMLTPEAESGDNSLGGNLLAPLKDKFSTDSVMNNQNVSDFYDKVDELAKNANSIKATDEDILKNKYMNSVNAELGELYKQKREIQSSSLSDDVKYRRVQSIQEQINNLARKSLNTYENVSINGDYATVGDLHYRWNEASDGTEAGWQKITDKQLEKQNKVTNTLGISASEYWSNKEEYDYAFDYPENYAVSKAVGGYEAYKTYTSDLYDIKADKDSNGKSISGSRKKKVADYLNSLDIDYYEKIILFKSEYNADDTYNVEIIDYLNSREDISYEDMAAILKELGFTVLSDGTIRW